MPDRTQTTASADSPVLAAALDYVAQGWPVFPVAGKRPLTSRGLKDATTDPEQVVSWWQARADTGIAIRTGFASRLFVLDVDGEQGADSLHALEQRHDELPATVRSTTGGGGQHFYFRHPGGELRNTAGKLGPGLDTRADGGYVVAPPSAHPSGRLYAWDVAPDEAAMAFPPAWLTRPSTPDRAPRPASEWRELTANGASIGQRNNRAASLAGHLFARGVDPYVVLELVAAWDESRNKPPLGRAEIEHTVGSIAARELAKSWR